MCIYVRVADCGFSLGSGSGVADGIGWERASNETVDRMIEESLKKQPAKQAVIRTATNTKKRMLLVGGTRR